MPTRRATPFTIQKPRRASDEILPAVLKTGSIPGVPQNGILAWFIARLDAPYETVEIEIQKDVTKYQVKNFQDIRAPLNWIEGTKGEVILSPLDKERIRLYRMQYPIWNTAPDIEEIEKRLNINPDLGSGIWTDEWQQIMNELNISEGDLLSYEQFSIAHQRILEIPDGHLSSTWYETVNTTETETKDVTNDIRRQIEYIWNNARSLHMQYIVKMLPSELRAHERTEALYDFIKLYEHYGYMLPKDGYMQLDSDEENDLKNPRDAVAKSPAKGEERRSHREEDDEEAKTATKRGDLAATMQLEARDAAGRRPATRASLRAHRIAAAALIAARLSSPARLT